MCYGQISLRQMPVCCETSQLWALHATTVPPSGHVIFFIYLVAKYRKWTLLVRSHLYFSQSNLALNSCVFQGNLCVQAFTVKCTLGGTLISAMREKTLSYVPTSEVDLYVFRLSTGEVEVQLVFFWCWQILHLTKAGLGSPGHHSCGRQLSPWELKTRTFLFISIQHMRPQEWKLIFTV